MRTCASVWLVVLLLAPTAWAQDTTEAPAPESVDARAVRAVYAFEAPAVTGPLRAVHATAVPLFGAAPVAVWGGTLLAGDDLAAPVEISVAWLGTFGAVTLTKNLVQRARPFEALDGIAQRGYGPDDYLDPYSFPSGHAALAFSIATSLSLSYPEWYVVAPAYAWASATALSRVWLGVHYPSDIAVGAILGGSIAVGVHFLVRPLFDGEGGADAALTRRPPLVGVRIPL